MEVLASGPLQKMGAQLQEPIAYTLSLGGTDVSMNRLLGQEIALHYHGEITCTYCGRKIKKSFNQGFCYPCFKRLARCDSCIVSPEKCHFAEGSCREPEWGESHCMREHFVYLANSSGVKVGITRGTQIPTRWIDQGAVQALPIMRVQTRLQSGLAEVVLKQHVADRTQWQRMLKGVAEPLDLNAIWQRLRVDCGDEFAELQQRFGVQAVQLLDEQTQVSLSYPVLTYPDKVKSLNLDKQARVEGTLLGIKGQYLILDSGVINMRKFTAYHVDLLAA